MSSSEKSTKGNVSSQIQSLKSTSEEIDLAKSKNFETNVETSVKISAVVFDIEIVTSQNFDFEYFDSDTFINENK